jgi:hypothetical protein
MGNVIAKDETCKCGGIIIPPCGLLICIIKLSVVNIRSTHRISWTVSNPTYFMSEMNQMTVSF